MDIAGFVSFIGSKDIVSALSIADNNYISALFILAVFIAFAAVFSLMAKTIVKSITSRTKTTLDDQLVSKTRGPVFKIIFLFGLLLAVIPLEIADGVAVLYKNAVYTLILFYFGKFVIAIINILLVGWADSFAKRTKSSIDKDVLPLLTKTVNATLYTLVFIMILNQWGVSIAPLLTGVGVAGLALGFAVQDSLKNIFGGISLILDRAYKVGDIIELGDGTTGKIHDIGLRSTKIVNWDNNLVTVPNGNMANMKITNMMWPETVIKTKIDIGVSYDSDVKKVKKVITEILKKNKKILFEERHPVVRLNSFGDSALNFLVLYWTNMDDRWDVFEDVNNALLSEFRKNKIEIPFPQRDVWIKEMKKGKSSRK